MEECQVVGYDLITIESTSAFSTSFLIASSLFAIGLLVQLYHYGMGMGDWDVPTDYNDVAVIKWVKTSSGWRQFETRGKYKDYINRFEYEWKWVASERDMGFVMNDPPAECTVFCSPGMRDAVDEIISNTPKETYY